MNRCNQSKKIMSASARGDEWSCPGAQGRGAEGAPLVPGIREEGNGVVGIGGVSGA